VQDKDEVARVALLLALAVAGVLVLADVVIPPGQVSLTTLYVLAPMVACAAVPVGGTIGVGALVTVAAIGSGFWNQVALSPQHLVRILTVVSVAAAAVIVAAVRVQREQRLAHVTRIAEIAQRAILPVLPARVREVQIAARYQSAGADAMVGGDLFDCYHSRDHVRLLVGDVRGKGIGGVEQAARVIRAFRQSAALQDDLVGVAREMDEYLAGFFGAEEFATALLVEVDPRGRWSHLELVSCGHPGPALVHGQRSEVLDLPPGPPLGLGLGLGSDFEAREVAWVPGDRLLMYTDGLSEARDGRGEFLQLDTLRPAIGTGSVEEALDEVLVAVSSHVRGGRLEDDLAAVLLENHPGDASDTARRTA
jgi:sigma-B regulation protein RsbU (phosphoserine phosphatase)